MTIDAHKQAEKIPIERWIEHYRNRDMIYYWSFSKYRRTPIPGLHYCILDYSKAYWNYETAITHGTCTWEAYFTGDKGIQYPGGQIESYVRGIKIPSRTTLTLRDIEFLLGL